MTQHQTEDLIASNWAERKQTFIIPLTFQNVENLKTNVDRIEYGGDIWELRVDLLSPSTEPLGKENLPPLDYVRRQVEALQGMSDLPILFTIRTLSQGGKFPDKAVDEAQALMELAIDLGVKYLDVEIEWPKQLLDVVTRRKGACKVVGSFHDWTGKVAWTSEELRERFLAADAVGDIIKLSILSAEVEDTYELGLFVRDYREKHTKPLLAVGMGANGQLSRITSPISLVTHPLIPFPSAPGQLSLAQVYQARHLMGQLPKRTTRVTGPARIQASIALEAAFKELGLPHEVSAADEAESSSSDLLLDTSDLGADPGALAGMVASGFTRLTGRKAPTLVITKALEAV